ncbi:hypothetical protein V5O48_011182 [Marasmius crinis-equi]|uniref:Uncharacterized protein n=1 Tax=Marasmius crinis-equi TaxID=585013 RepID=A0ABR3F6Q3_9AGAR
MFAKHTRRTTQQAQKTSEELPYHHSLPSPAATRAIPPHMAVGNNTTTAHNPKTTMQTSSSTGQAAAPNEPWRPLHLSDATSICLPVVSRTNINSLSHTTTPSDQGKGKDRSGSPSRSGDDGEGQNHEADSPLSQPSLFGCQEPVASTQDILEETNHTAAHLGKTKLPMALASYGLRILSRVKPDSTPPKDKQPYQSLPKRDTFKKHDYKPKEHKPFVKPNFDHSRDSPFHPKDPNQSNWFIRIIMEEVKDESQQTKNTNLPTDEQIWNHHEQETTRMDNRSEPEHSPDSFGSSQYTSYESSEEHVSFMCDESSDQDDSDFEDHTLAGASEWLAAAWEYLDVESDAEAGDIHYSE